MTNIRLIQVGDTVQINTLLPFNKKPGIIRYMGGRPNYWTACVEWSDGLLGVWPLDRLVRV